MPSSAVTVTFQRVVRNPSKTRQKAVQPAPYKTRPLSPLAAYIAENAGEGLTIHELAEQFQEYDCCHEWGMEPIGVTEQENIFQCQECGLTKHRLRPGRFK